MEFVYEFSAEMTCVSCSNCITKVLERNKMKSIGINKFEVDLAGKKVTVEGTVSKEEITDILQKTGISIRLLSATPKNA